MVESNGNEKDEKPKKEKSKKSKSGSNPVTPKLSRKDSKRLAKLEKKSASGESSSATGETATKTEKQEIEGLKSFADDDGFLSPSPNNEGQAPPIPPAFTKTHSRSLSKGASQILGLKKKKSMKDIGTTERDVGNSEKANEEDRRKALKKTGSLIGGLRNIKSKKSAADGSSLSSSPISSANNTPVPSPKPTRQNTKSKLQTTLSATSTANKSGLSNTNAVVPTPAHEQQFGFSHPKFNAEKFARDLMRNSDGTSMDATSTQTLISLNQRRNENNEHIQSVLFNNYQLVIHLGKSMDGVDAKLRNIKQIFSNAKDHFLGFQSVCELEKNSDASIKLAQSSDMSIEAKYDSIEDMHNIVSEVEIAIGEKRWKSAVDILINYMDGNNSGMKKLVKTTATALLTELKQSGLTLNEINEIIQWLVDLGYVAQARDQYLIVQLVNLKSQIENNINEETMKEKEYIEWCCKLIITTIITVNDHFSTLFPSPESSSSFAMWSMDCIEFFVSILAAKVLYSNNFELVNHCMSFARNNIIQLDNMGLSLLFYFDRLIVMQKTKEK